jgi:hypothetical protein
MSVVEGINSGVEISRITRAASFLATRDSLLTLQDQKYDERNG